MSTMYGIRVRKEADDVWKRVRTITHPLGRWSKRYVAEGVLAKLIDRGYRGHVFPITVDEPLRISDWLYGTKPGALVAVADVSEDHRSTYKATLLAAARAGKRLNRRIPINSSYRSYAQQEALYQAYLNGTGALAAKPGTSDHNKGKALDIPNARDDAKLKAALEAEGFRFSVASERWHVSRG